MAAKKAPSRRRQAARRLLVVLAVVGAVAGSGAGLWAFSGASSSPKQISYRGRMYMGVVEVTAIEVRANFGRLRRGSTATGGPTLFVSSGSPPAVVAVPLPDGHFNAYQLMR